MAGLNSSVAVNDIFMSYVSEGSGETVVFLHGAFSDHRVWQPQQNTIAQHYRFVAPTMRYFGDQPWIDDGHRYSQKTHANDIAAFIRALACGPVFLVARSYGSTVALRLALDFPELVRGVLAQEPTIAVAAVRNRQDLATLQRERAQLKAASEAAYSGDYDRATRLYADWTNANPGGFDALDEDLRRMHLQNGRTLPLHLGSASRDPLTSCAELGRIRCPVMITTGESTRAFFSILASATQRCIEGAELQVIAGARHAAPSQNPAAFNALVLQFLDQHQSIAHDRKH
jgi:pimeloyl-ACP methyl ester carboxylesterase